MKNLKYDNRDLLFVKRFVIAEFWIIAAIIVSGGIVYGAQSSSRWWPALMSTIALLAGTAITMTLTYCRAEQRLKKFNR